MIDAGGAFFQLCPPMMQSSGTVNFLLTFVIYFIIISYLILCLSPVGCLDVLLMYKLSRNVTKHVRCQSEDSVIPLAW